MVDFVQVEQYLSLVDNVIDMLHTSDCFLPESLQGYEPLLFLVPCFMYLSKVADADNLVQLEISDLWFRFIFDLFSECVFR